MALKVDFCWMKVSFTILSLLKNLLSLLSQKSLLQLSGTETKFTRKNKINKDEVLVKLFRQMPMDLHASKVLHEFTEAGTLLLFLCSRNFPKC
jgi:hypothetical protein